MELIMDFAFPIIIFLFFLFSTLLKKALGKGKTSGEPGNHTEPRRKMYDTWEDVIGRVKGELNPSEPNTTNEIPLRTHEGSVRQQNIEVSSTFRSSEKETTVDDEDGAYARSNRTPYARPTDELNGTETPISIGSKAIVQGIIMTEVLGKPRAFKPYQYRKRS